MSGIRIALAIIAIICALAVLFGAVDVNTVDALAFALICLAVAILVP